MRPLVFIRRSITVACVTLGLANAVDARPYLGRVKWYIADLKTSFPEHELYSEKTALTDNSFKIVLNGLKVNAHVNGLRLPIIPGLSKPEAYSTLYKDVVGYARQLGLAIYASPMSVGMSAYDNWSDQQYAQWLADYADYFKPDFLSPFNEAGISHERMAKIMASLRSHLHTKTLLVGPDRQHVSATLNDLARNGDLADAFDILSSHNANRDHSATLQNWKAIVNVAGARPVWASEAPSNWISGNEPSLPGLVDAVGAGVEGIVIWAAKPGLVDDDGRLTQKALDIAKQLAR